jgi:hypothetical protein
MPQTEMLFEKYEQAIEKLLKHYVNLYLSICSGTPTVYAGKEFIAMYNATYQKEINDIATNIINENTSGSRELYYRVLKQNQQAVHALFNRIMNLSLGITSSNEKSA